MSLPDDEGLLTDIQGIAHVVVGYQYADTALAQMGDDLLDVVDGDWIHPCKGLVQKNEIRFGGQSPGDFYASAFASGQCLAQAVPQVLHIELFQQPVALLEALGEGWAESSAIIKDEDACIRCALCATRCPNSAITMERMNFTEVLK